jgi:hypothetical protein
MTNRYTPTPRPAARPFKNTHTSSLKPAGHNSHDYKIVMQLYYLTKMEKQAGKAARLPKNDRRVCAPKAQIPVVKNQDSRGVDFSLPFLKKVLVSVLSPVQLVLNKVHV